jgi:hypothetical protein
MAPPRDRPIYFDTAATTRVAPEVREAMVQVPAAPTLFANYYEHHARQFFEDTIAIDMSPLYTRFLHWLPNRGLILRNSGVRS